MISKVFGELKPADFDSETALEGTFQALGEVDCYCTLRSDLGADTVVRRAEELFLLFQNNLSPIKQAIKDWIPTLYDDAGFQFDGDADRILEALEIDNFHFIIGDGDSQSWFYSNVEKGLSPDEQDSLLTGHDIVVYLDNDMQVTDLQIDG